MKTNQSGQSLFEVVLSLAVITIIIVALIILAANSIKNANFSKTRTLATNYAQDTNEWLRSERDKDFDAFAERAQSPYCLVELSWTSAKVGSCDPNDFISGTNLQREVSFTILSSTTIEAEVLIYWDDSKGTHEVRTTTDFTDWRSR